MTEVNKFDEIKKLINNFFEKMCFEADLEFLDEENGITPVNLKVKEPQILIGDRGQTLADMQKIIKLMVKKEIGEDVHIELDINNYKKQKVNYLKDLALSSANEVALNRRAKELQPMSAYERRIIHMTIADRDDVETESIGAEPERKIMIKPSLF